MYITIGILLLASFCDCSRWRGNTKYFLGSECDASILSLSIWSGGFIGRFTINGGSSGIDNGWSMKIEMNIPTGRINAQGSKISKENGKVITLGNLHWNKIISAGSERTFSIYGIFDGNPGNLIKSIQINGGRSLNCITKSPSLPTHGGGVDTTISATTQVRKLWPATLPSKPIITLATNKVTNVNKENYQSTVQATESTATHVDTTTSKVVSSTEAVKEVTVATPNNITGRGVFVPYPSKMLGLYLPLAYERKTGYTSTDTWMPRLYRWQQMYSNVLFFSFIHPTNMDVPKSFQKLAASRQMSEEDYPGRVPSNTVIIFAIANIVFSNNPWKWLTTCKRAEAMAEKVGEWPEKYGIDGIDLDFVDGAGEQANASKNVVCFIRRLRTLVPNIIISLSVLGYPTYVYSSCKKLAAESYVINESWDGAGVSYNLVDSIGIMVYEGTQALNYVKNYGNVIGSERSNNQIKARVPNNVIILGTKGNASKSDLVSLAEASVARDFLGIIVWYSSVKNGFAYAKIWDASMSSQSIDGYEAVAKILGIKQI